MPSLKECEGNQQRNYCRICLEQTKPLKKLPCLCKGSLSYMHDICLNQMLHVKLENQKEDVPDYIQSLPTQLNALESVKAKCEICLDEIMLQKECRLNFYKLMDVQMEVYFVLFGISCISVLGLNIAFNLLRKALEETGFFVKILYFGAYVWIVGVILYVILEPLYSQIKVTKFSIKCQSGVTTKERSSSVRFNDLRQKCKYYLKKLIPYEFMRIKEKINQQKELSCSRSIKLKSKDRRKSRSQSQTKNYSKGSEGGKYNYFQI